MDTVRMARAIAGIEIIRMGRAVYKKAGEYGCGSIVRSFRKNQEEIDMDFNAEISERPCLYKAFIEEWDNEFGDYGLQVAYMEWIEENEDIAQYLEEAYEEIMER